MGRRLRVGRTLHPLLAGSMPVVEGWLGQPRLGVMVRHHLRLGLRYLGKVFPQDLRRPPGSQRHALTHRDGNGEILFGATHEYHDMQTVVTYTHAADAWAGPNPSFDADRLPRTVKKISDRRPLRIALLGDSISTGCNASGWRG